MANKQQKKNKTKTTPAHTNKCMSEFVLAAKCVGRAEKRQSDQVTHPLSYYRMRLGVAGVGFVSSQIMYTPRTPETVPQEYDSHFHGRYHGIHW